MNDPTSPASPQPLSPEEFDELDAILDDLRSRYDETPQWEFFEGFMAALVCCRRPIPPSEYLPLLLALGEEDASDDEGSFQDAAQQQRFMDLWERRRQEVQTALDADVQNLDDDQSYHPEVLDVRGSVAALDEAERAELESMPLPYFAQVWALGFMFVVESWSDEWDAPRDKEAAKVLNAALEAIVAITEDDTDPPTLAMFSEDGPPSVSLKRLNAFGEAIWAVYDLRELWLSFGPRVETIRKEPTPGRNDLCPCGSGKKYKKCHGAT